MTNNSTHSKTYPGTLSNGASSRPIYVHVGLEVDGICASPEDSELSPVRWPFTSLSCDVYSGSTIIFLKDNDTNIITVENEALGHIVKSKLNSFYRFSGVPPLYKLAILIGVLFLGIIAVWQIATKTSPYVASKVPVEWEVKLGEKFSDSLQSKSCNTVETTKILSKIRDRIVTKPIPFDVKILILRDNVVNAYALPGGTIAFTHKFLEQADSPEEIAGVMAHELQHVKQRHVMTSIVRGTFLTILWSLAIGDYTGFMVIDPSFAYTILTSKFDRDQEASADIAAAKMLRAANVSSHGLQTFFTKMQNKDKLNLGKWLEFASTHPSDASRIQSIEKLVKSVPTIQNSKPLLDTSEWALLKKGCVDPEKLK